MEAPPGYWNLLGLSPTGDLGPYTAYYSHRRKLVWFPKAPPLAPPSLLQTMQRNRWRMIAIAWASLTQAQRNAWERATKKSRARITGYNLFTYWYTTQDLPTIQTIERQSGEKLT